MACLSSMNSKRYQSHRWCRLFVGFLFVMVAMMPPVVTCLDGAEESAASSSSSAAAAEAVSTEATDVPKEKLAVLTKNNNVLEDKTESSTITTEQNLQRRNQEDQVQDDSSSSTTASTSDKGEIQDDSVISVASNTLEEKLESQIPEHAVVAAAAATTTTTTTATTSDIAEQLKQNQVPLVPGDNIISLSSNNNNDEKEEVVKTGEITVIDKSNDQSRLRKRPQENFNATAISLGTCQKIEYAVLYMASLNFDENIFSSAKTLSGGDQPKFWFDVYLLQMVTLPVSLALAFFGSSLLLPACAMTAAGLGVFVVFHFVNNYFRGGLDCQMKLALSGVSATLAAMGAAAFVRFGLFTLGTVSAGVGAYTFFDAFPHLDPGHGLNATVTVVPAITDRVTDASDLSPYAWIIVMVFAICGGLCLRLYEQVSLEIITAILGGVGVSYTVHTFVILQGGSLDRSVVFLIASCISIAGRRFQRRRRINKIERLYSSPYKNGSRGRLPHYDPRLVDEESWGELQRKIDMTNDLLEKHSHMDDIATELSDMLNSFQEKIKQRTKDN